MATDLDLRFQTVLANDLPASSPTPPAALERSDAVEDRLARPARAGRASTRDRQRPPASGLSGAGRGAGRSPDNGRGSTRPAAAARRCRHSAARVVLIDFWTYTCINCLRTLPYLRAWERPLRESGPDDRGGAHAGVRLRARHRQRQRAIRQNELRYAVAAGQRVRDLERVGQPVLARQVPDRRARRRALHALRRRRVRRDEKAIRSLLREAGSGSLGRYTRATGEGASSGTSTPETYLGYARAPTFRAPPGRACTATPDDPPRAEPLRDRGRLARRPRVRHGRPRGGAVGALRRAEGLPRAELARRSREDRARAARRSADPVGRGGERRAGAKLRVSGQRLYRLVSMPRVEERTLGSSCRRGSPPTRSRSGRRPRGDRDSLHSPTRRDSVAETTIEGLAAGRTTARAGRSRCRTRRRARSSPRCRRSGPSEVAAVVARARAAQPGWEALGFDGRAKILRRAQKWTIDNADRIARTIVSETGKTYEDAQLAEVSYAAPAPSASGPRTPRSTSPTRRSARPRRSCWAASCSCATRRSAWSA